MVLFWWLKVEYDIVLCKEYIDYWLKKYEDWEYLVSMFCILFDLNGLLKVRGCWEYLDLLIKKYKVEERKVLKR